MNKEWIDHLENEMKQPYFVQLRAFIKAEQAVKHIYPENGLIFNAFEQCPWSELKVVILGGEPYSNGSDHGLAWSTNSGVIPDPLFNIFKEIRKDEFEKFEHTSFSFHRTPNLIQWAKQGVLLMNMLLTAEKGKQGAHKGKGWETFTQNTIKLISEKKDHVVFMLWGKTAQEYRGLIDLKKHLVLEAAHPSPFTAHQGFFGCKHFTQANQFIIQHYINGRTWNQQPPIAWHTFK